MDILLAFPGLLLAIAMVAVLGPSLTNVIIALSLIGWVGYARLVRGQVLRARELEFVQAARALGATIAADPGAARHSNRAASRDRPGDARHGRRNPGGSGAELSRPGGAAADTELGNDAQLRPRRICSRRRTSPSFQASPSRCWCSGSTSSGTVCGMRWIPTRPKAEGLGYVERQ